MGGRNPYLKPVEFELPTRKYRITFRHDGRETVVEVDPAKIPYGRDGLPGSLLDIALGHGIAVDHACGGVCACSTCHLIVREGSQTLNEQSDQEADQLDNAPGLTPQSRLGCQSVPNGTTDLVVEVPNWNRNLVREEHH
jgi:2Fe-2S ferredoxin